MHSNWLSSSQRELELEGVVQGEMGGVFQGEIGEVLHVAEQDGWGTAGQEGVGMWRDGVMRLPSLSLLDSVGHPPLVSFIV